MYKKALRIAKKAHDGQIDKGGRPYIDHPKKVASLVKTKDEKIVALLHDVCEDTDITLDDLRKLKFSEKIVKAVDAITKRDDEDYFTYIERVNENEIAKKVKIADATHNSDISRIDNPSKKDIDRCLRYEKTIRRLDGTL